MPPAHGSHAAPPSVPARRRHWLAALVVGLLVTLLGTLGWLVGYSSVLATRSVHVSGLRTLTPDAVRSAAAVPLGRPLLRQDLDAIAHRVAQLRPVRSVEVSRSWPRTVKVDIQERTARLAIRQPTGFVLVDDQGQAFLSRPAMPPGVLLADVDPGNVALLVKVGVVAGALPPGLLRQVRSIAASTPDGISLRLTDGDAVFWGNAGDSGLKSQVLLALLKRSASHYDVSAPHNPSMR